MANNSPDAVPSLAMRLLLGLARFIDVAFDIAAGGRRADDDSRRCRRPTGGSRSLERMSISFGGPTERAGTNSASCWT